MSKQLVWVMTLLFYGFAVWFIYLAIEAIREGNDFLAAIMLAGSGLYLSRMAYWYHRT